MTTKIKAQTQMKHRVLENGLKQIFTVKNSRSGCDFSISGQTLIEAIENNFSGLAENANVGNAAGYRLENVVAEYSPGILGGKGGCCLTIVATGSPLAHTGETGPAKTYSIWIYASREDISTPYTFTIKIK